MKCILLTILTYVVTLEAKPQPYMGLVGRGVGVGTGIGTGLDTIGMEGLGLASGFSTGLGTGLDVSGLGTGLGRRAGEYSHGGSFGDNQYNFGANGFGNQEYRNRGFNNFHNIGQHHNSLTSITQAENTDNHDIGGSQAFDTGAQSNAGYNQFGNGRSRFGNEYGSGRHMISFL